MLRRMRGRAEATDVDVGMWVNREIWEDLFVLVWGLARRFIPIEDSISNWIP